MTEVPPYGVVVVTGATGGLGHVIVDGLIDDGHIVIAQFHTDGIGAQALRVAAEQKGGTCIPVQAELSTSAGAEAFVDAVAALLRKNESWRLRGLINNAALVLGPGFGSTTADLFDRYVAVNVRAPFLLTQALSSLMEDGSSIVNISSAGVTFSSPGDIIYVMTKAALEALTRHAAEPLARRGIRINAVVAGFTDNGHPGYKFAKVRDHLGAFAALGGIAEPEVISDAVRFLLSPASRRSTGSLLDVSGGSTLGVPRPGGSVRDLAQNHPSA
jgi:3-oxoacyl-[acyl-carrier protein] reductase